MSFSQNIFNHVLKRKYSNLDGLTMSAYLHQVFTNQGAQLSYDRFVKKWCNWVRIVCVYKLLSAVADHRNIIQNTITNLILLVNDNETFVSRSCDWEDIKMPANNCIRETKPPNRRNIFCETCDHDGCNSSSLFAVCNRLIFIAIIVKFCS